MKHIRTILLLICLSLMLVGCQQTNDTNTIDGDDQTTQSPSNDTNVPLGAPAPSISVRSLEALEEMREMISCTDEERLQQYLQSVEGGGANSKKDLESFIKLVDAIPYTSLIDGDITWISCSSSISEDTGKQSSVVFVTKKAENGDWVRFEYDLMTTDVSGAISEQLEQMPESEVLAKPILSKDGKIAVYSETRKGETIVWKVNIGGVFARIVYHVSDLDSVSVNDVFSNCVVSEVK